MISLEHPSALITLFIVFLLCQFAFERRNFSNKCFFEAHFRFSSCRVKMKVVLAKFFGWFSVVKNAAWIGVLMVCMTLVDPNDFMAVIYRVGLKSLEFYIIWSTYGTFKLFKSFKQVTRNFSQSIDDLIT